MRVFIIFVVLNTLLNTLLIFCRLYVVHISMLFGAFRYIMALCTGLEPTNRLRPMVFNIASSPCEHTLIKSTYFKHQLKVLKLSVTKDGSYIFKEVK